MEEARKKCARCGVNHRLTFYRKDKTIRYGGIAKEYRHTVCIECERKEREAKKRNDPDYMYKNKAQNSLSKHAKRNGMRLQQFCDFYDLTVDYIAYLIKKEWLAYDALGLDCPSCRCRHSEDDPLTFDKLTIDRIDRNEGYYQSNIRIVCKTYNTGKGKKGPIDYDKECRDYREHEKAIKDGVQFDLPRVSVARKSARISRNQLDLFQLDS